MTTPPRALAALLDRDWVASREEDAGDLRVFRPAGWRFPPTRAGRKGLRLAAGGRATERAPGPVDRTVATGARWRLLPDGTVRLDRAGSAWTFAVVEASADRLVLRTLAEG